MEIHEVPPSAPPPNPVRELREKFGVSRKIFGVLLGDASERAVAGWENGETLTERIRRELHACERLHQALTEIMKEEEDIPSWLAKPNPSFSNFSPLQAIQSGQIDLVWRHIYCVQSGLDPIASRTGSAEGW